MAVWQCRLLLGIVCVHLALTSPVVRRDVLALTHEQANPLAQLQPETLGEEAFGGPVTEARSSREKRLLKTVSLGALAVKGAKAVGAKVVAGAAKAVGAKILKTGAVVKAAAAGTVGLKAKAIGVKAVTAVAALGIKALIFKLLFGLTKSSLQPRPQKAVTTAPGTEGEQEGEVPEFDPNKISLQVPDELFAPAFNSVNSISTVVGNLIQNTAERVAKLVERLKPILRSSLGFRSRKRQTEKEEEKKKNNDSWDNTGDDELSNSETTFFTDSDEIQEVAGSETRASTRASTVEDSEDTQLSSIKTSYTALVDQQS